MYKYVIGLLVVVLLSMNNAVSKGKDIFSDHKLRSYTPLKAGVKDMFFDLRKEGLIERIKRTTALSNISDVYFRIYWSFPNNYKIVVEGLPPGFNILRKGLRNEIKPFIELIFSDEYIKQFSKINFLQDVADKKVFRKKKSKDDITEVKIRLDKNGLLSEIASKSPYSRVVTKLENGIRSWSNGKYVVKNIVITESSNGIDGVKSIVINRNLFDGVGLPAKVEFTQSVMKNKKTISKVVDHFNFGNYQINTGKAKKFINGKK